MTSSFLNRHSKKNTEILQKNTTQQNSMETGLTIKSPYRVYEACDLTSIEGSAP